MHQFTAATTGGGKSETIASEYWDKPRKIVVDPPGTCAQKLALHQPEQSELVYDLMEYPGISYNIAGVGNRWVDETADGIVSIRLNRNIATTPLL